MTESRLKTRRLAPRQWAERPPVAPRRPAAYLMPAEPRHYKYWFETGGVGFPVHVVGFLTPEVHCQIAETANRVLDVLDRTVGNSDADFSECFSKHLAQLRECLAPWGAVWRLRTIERALTAVNLP